jgi:hypothetical protein
MSIELSLGPEKQAALTDINAPKRFSSLAAHNGPPLCSFSDLLQARN